MIQLDEKNAFPKKKHCLFRFSKEKALNENLKIYKDLREY